MLGGREHCRQGGERGGRRKGHRHRGPAGPEKARQSDARDQRDGGQVHGDDEDREAHDHRQHEDRHRLNELPPELSHCARHERENADWGEQQHPLHDPDERPGAHVREIGQRPPLFIGERSGGHGEDRDEHDQRKQVGVHGRPDRVRGDQIDEEARAGGDLLRGAPDEAGVRRRGLAQRRLLLRRDGGERQEQRREAEADQNRGERGGPEEPQGPDTQPPDAAEVAEPCDPREESGRYEGDHDHGQEIEKDGAERPQARGDRQEQGTLRHGGGEPEDESRGEAHRHPHVASHRSQDIIPARMIIGIAPPLQAGFGAAPNQLG